MPDFPFALALVLTGPEKKDLGQHPIRPDWLPVREAIQLELLKQYGNAARPVGYSDFTIEPAFSPESGEPWLDGVVATVGSNGGKFSFYLPNAAFVRPAARLLSAKMVADKRVEAGDLITYRAVAYPAGKAEPPQVSPFAEIAILPPINEIESLDLLFPNSSLAPGNTGEPAVELPIYVPESLLSELTTGAEASAKVETGGLLIGRLHRHPIDGGHRIALEITAQIPAEYTEASETSLRFNHDSWAAADRALRLRESAGKPHQSNEIVIGWHHSHPSKFWCPDTCPMENRLSCPKQAPFFSGDDLSLHREVFPKAYHIALLVNVADAGTTFHAYASTRGTVSEVPFRIIPSSAS